MKTIASLKLPTPLIAHTKHKPINGDSRVSESRLVYDDVDNYMDGTGPQLADDGDNIYHMDQQLAYDDVDNKGHIEIKQIYHGNGTSHVEPVKKVASLKNSQGKVIDFKGICG